MFNNNIVNLALLHKHLGMMLDTKLSSDKNLKSVLRILSVTIDLHQIFHFIFSVERTYQQYIIIC